MAWQPPPWARCSSRPAAVVTTPCRSVRPRHRQWRPAGRPRDAVDPRHAPGGHTGDIPVEWEGHRQRLSPPSWPGQTTALASKDFTVKVDATGLKAATAYHYRFRAYAATSPTAAPAPAHGQRRAGQAGGVFVRQPPRRLLQRGTPMPPSAATWTPPCTWATTSTNTARAATHRPTPGHWAACPRPPRNPQPG